MASELAGDSLALRGLFSQCLLLQSFRGQRNRREESSVWRGQVIKKLLATTATLDSHVQSAGTDLQLPHLATHGETAPECFLRQAFLQLTEMKSHL